MRWSRAWQWGDDIINIYPFPVSIYSALISGLLAPMIIRLYAGTGRIGSYAVQVQLPFLLVSHRLRRWEYCCAFWVLRPWRRQLVSSLHIAQNAVLTPAYKFGKVTLRRPWTPSQVIDRKRRYASFPVPRTRLTNFLFPFCIVSRQAGLYLGNSRRPPQEL
jgi:hypothetical protein